MPDADGCVIERPAEARLALAERLFGLHPLGDVLDGPEHAHELAALIDRRSPPRLYDPHRPVIEDQAEGAVVGPTVPHRLIEQVLDARPVFRVDPVPGPLQRDGRIPRLEPEDAVMLVRPVEGAARQVPVPAPDSGELLGLDEQGLAATVFLFSLPSAP